MIFELLICAILLLVFWYHIKYRERNKILKKIPAWKSLPLIGSSWIFIGKSPAGIFQELRKASQELGQIWRIDFTPFYSMIFVCEPEAVEKILSNYAHIEKSREYRFLNSWLREGRIS